MSVPDLVVIADTGRERRTTWEYMRDVMQPYLGDLLTIQVAPHTLARKDLFDASGLTLMPAYTAEGRLSAFCSGEWKRDVIERWIRQAIGGRKKAISWIGYSIDEIRRVPKNDHRAWCALEFPLIDRFLNRAMCMRLIEAAGLPVPHKSRCYQCPHQNEKEWAETLADPVDGPLAIAVDRAVREADPEQKGLFLHYSRVPLDMVKPGEGIQPPSAPCEGGHCWT